MEGFTVTANGYGMRVECNSCHASKDDSQGMAWAYSHKAKCS